MHTKNCWIEHKQIKMHGWTRKKGNIIVPEKKEEIKTRLVNVWTGFVITFRGWERVIFDTNNLWDWIF